MSQKSKKSLNAFLLKKKRCLKKMPLSQINTHGATLRQWLLIFNIPVNRNGEILTVSRKKPKY